MWKCPKCGREFNREKQSHSCVVYPIENHFQNKVKGKLLFETLVKKIEKKIGEVKIESLPCCIHLVSDHTFSGVWVSDDKIRIDFSVDYSVEDKRVVKEVKLSKNRTIYYIDIESEGEIDKVLLEWIKDSYYLNK